MFYQVIGQLDPRQGMDQREKLLGCIRIDPSNFVRTVDQTKVAFYAFEAQGGSSTHNSFCSINGEFLTVTGTHPGSEEKDRDVLFLYPTKSGRKEVWRFLIPSHNGHSQTGSVIHGVDALNRLQREILTKQ